ncbi:MAG: TIGR03862 family flavoprotein [Hyphomicrobiales bacterium]|nr:TIGR03862 family flavoprotein [Hyphomicrobiales bacterium]
MTNDLAHSRLSPWNVVIAGGGPAGLMAAEVLAAAGATVTVYDRMPSIGRKFLLAGRGGLNLTHSEPLEQFMTRYGDAPFLRNAINAFTPEDLIAWCEALGQPTFVGSSDRVFPKTMKSSPLLRSWLQRLTGLGVEFKLRHSFVGWEDDGRLAFETPQGRIAVKADAAILAFGGASWPQLGSNGDWVEPFRAAGVAVTPMQPANSGFKADWSDFFRDRFAGQPLKDIELRLGGTAVRGEVMLTRDGVEGNAVYALGPDIRKALGRESPVIVHIDLKPGANLDGLAAQLSALRGKQSFANFLRKTVKLSPAATGLLNETARDENLHLSSMTPDNLAARLKAAPIRLYSPASIAKAISTAGGVQFGEIDEKFMLTRHPGTFVAGEMLDWEAPTGGYLLQACFATGVAAGRGAIQWLRDEPLSGCDR